MAEESFAQMVTSVDLCQNLNGWNLNPISRAECMGLELVVAFAQYCF